MPAKVRRVTVYRLVNVSPTTDAMLDAMTADKLGAEDFDVDEIEFAGRPVLVFTRQFPPETAGWCAELSALTGRDIRLDRSDGAAVLVLSVDDNVFAIGYGQGFHYIPARLKEADFGLRCALRAVDPARVREVSRKRLSLTTRQDDTYTPTGVSIGGVGVHERTELVKRLGGLLEAADLGLDHRAQVSMSGADGLRLPMPVDQSQFLAVLRRLNDIANREVQEDFEAVAAIEPVSDAVVSSKLDGMLADGLRGGSAMDIACAMPVDMFDVRQEVDGYVVQIAGQSSVIDELDITVLRAMCRDLDDPVQALRDGEIAAWFGRGAGPGCVAIRWIEASASIGSQIYFLREGRWHQCGATYFDSISTRIQELIPDKPELALPPWPNGESESRYNKAVAGRMPGTPYVSLDTKLIKTSVHAGNGFEACDGFTGSLVLVHVKASDGAAPLSHLVNQVQSSTEALCLQAEARKKFAALVEAESGGQITVPPDFMPTKVILAIKLKRKELTPANLYPLAKVAIVNMADSLIRYYGVAVEVVGIPHD
ncbi:TIGR04141 family sporadically distributed protein [Nocardia sp. NPDC055029]